MEKVGNRVLLLFLPKLSILFCDLLLQVIFSVVQKGEHLTPQTQKEMTQYHFLQAQHNPYTKTPIKGSKPPLPTSGVAAFILSTNNKGLLALVERGFACPDRSLDTSQ